MIITPKTDHLTEGFNTETVTVQDCIDNYRIRGLATVISNGEVQGFVKEFDVGAEFGDEKRNVNVVQRFTAGVADGALAVTG